MKRISVVVLLLAMICARSPAYFETDLLNLKVPTNLKPATIMLDIQHRMLTGFNGANVAIGLRYLVWSKLEVSGSYAKYLYNSTNEVAGTLSYAYFVHKILRAQADLQFFSYSRPGGTQQKQGILSQLALQTEPLGEILTPVLNVAYDTDQEKIGLGVGLNAAFAISLGPIQRLNVAGEYYPLLSRSGGENSQAKNVFAAGVTFETYGHHFMFLVGNSQEMGNRRLMRGTTGNDLYFGFNIHRFLDLKSF